MHYNYKLDENILKTLITEKWCTIVLQILPKNAVRVLNLEFFFLQK